MTAAQYPPQPLPDLDTEGFWNATAAGRLALCRCDDCGLWLQPPLERCRRCAGATSFQDVAGTGTVFTFIIQRQPSVTGFVDANGTTPQNNTGSDVFVYDRTTGLNTLVSHAYGSAVTTGNDSSYAPSFSGDGRFLYVRVVPRGSGFL